MNRKIIAYLLGGVALFALIWIGAEPSIALALFGAPAFALVLAWAHERTLGRKYRAARVERRRARADAAQAAHYRRRATDIGHFAAG